MHQPHRATPEQLEGHWYRAAVSRSVAATTTGIGAAQIQVGPESDARQQALLTLSIRDRRIHLNGYIEKAGDADTYRWRGRLGLRLIPRQGWHLLTTRERGLIAASTSGSLTFNSGTVLFAAHYLNVQQATHMALERHDELGLTRRDVEALNWLPSPTPAELHSSSTRWVLLTRFPKSEH